MKLFAAVNRVVSAGNIKSFLPLLVFVAAFALIAAIFFSSFRKIETLIQKEKLGELATIADIKVGQIVAWRDTQQRVAESLMRDSALAAEFGQWLQEGAPMGERRQRLLQMMTELRHVNGYRSLALFDREGTVRLSLEDGHVMTDENMALARQAMAGRKKIFSDFCRDSYPKKGIHLDLAAPLIVSARKPDDITGAVVMQIDPYTHLYPLILTWPAHSASAETLLVRREGDDILFLNELRHMKGAALTMSMPLDAPNLPSAMAIRGRLHTAEGVDYRGIPVVSAMREIPGTPWFMVSKVDRDEIFSPIGHLKQWAAILGLAFLLSGGLLVYYWLQGYRARFRLLQEQHAAAIEREMLEKHYESLTRYASDIILVADDAGSIVEANERAQQAYGYTRDEMLGMQLTDLRDQADDPAIFQQQIEKLRQLGELRYEAVNLRKDGSRFPVEVSARLVEVKGARYQQAIIRDISERRQVEDALRRSETLLRESQQMVHIGSWELDLKKNNLYWSDEIYRIFEITPAQFGGTYEDFLNAIHPEDREMVGQAYIDSVTNRTPYAIVHRLLFSGQRIKYVQEWCETYYDNDGEPLRSIGTAQDVTVQQLALNALRKSSQEFKDLYNHAPCGYHSLDKEGIIVQINDTELAWLGYARNEVVGKMSFVDMVSPEHRQVFLDCFSGFKASGLVQDQEYEMVRKDGTRFPALLNATAVYDAQGQYVSSRATLFDISARKLAERYLRESEERFRVMVDNAPIIIWMADAQGRKTYQGCNFFNKQWHDFTGLSLEQTEGRKWLRLVHEEDRKRCLDTYTNAFREVCPFKLEYRLRRHDGVYHWVSDSGVPRFSGEGEFLGFIGTCLNITEHKLFEEIRAEMEHAGRINIAGEMASGLAHELSQPLTAANNYLDVCLRRLAETDWDREGFQKAVRLAHAQTDRAGQIVNHLKNFVRKQKPEQSLLDINSLIRDTADFLDYEFKQHSINTKLDFSPVPLALMNRIEIEQILINIIKNAIDSMRSSSRRELRIVTRVVEPATILVTVIDTGKGVAVDDLEKIFNPFDTSKKEGLGLGLAICRSLVENYGGRIWAEQNDDVGTRFNFTLPVGVNYA